LKKLFLFVVFVLSFTNLFAQSENLIVMTYNIRCVYCEDSSSVNHWSKRKYLVAYLIKNHNPDLIGLQEAELFQIKDLVEMLNDYNWIGVGREDGKERGEAAAILFRKSRFNLEEEKTLWLSETPEIVSKGWDAALNRTVTIVKFKEKISSKEFYMFNTHFDHIGEKARTESSKLIIAEILKVQKNLPVILTGDFNYKSNAEGYKHITANLLDADRITKNQSTGGNITFNGFGKDIETDNKIDFIFVNDKINILNHNIDTTTYNGLYPSDHYSVDAEMIFK